MTPASDPRRMSERDIPGNACRRWLSVGRMRPPSGYSMLSRGSRPARVAGPGSSSGAAVCAHARRTDAARPSADAPARALAHADDERRRRGGDAHRGRRDAGSLRASWPSGSTGWPARWRRWASATRRPRGDVRVELASSHLELYLAVPCMGAVLHTLNIRLFRRAADLHRQPRPGQAGVRRRLARRGARAGRRRRSRPSRSSATVDARCPTTEYEELLAAQEPGSTTPSSTTARPPASVTRAAPPATRRASCTRTARTCCTRWRKCLRRRRGHRLATTACCRSSRCSTPTPGASRTRAR